MAHINVVAATHPCEDATTDLLNPWQTLVDGEYAGSTLVEVDLVNLRMDLNNKQVYRNCVVLYGVPTDVCVGLDTAIDGKADGTSGSCVAIAAPFAVGINSPIGSLAESADRTAIMPRSWGDPSDTANYGLQDLAIVLDF